VHIRFKMGTVADYLNKPRVSPSSELRVHESFGVLRA
jgi:hypothetical protein